MSEPQRQSRTPWYIVGAALAVAVAVVVIGLLVTGDSDDSGSTSAKAASEATLPPHVVRTSEIEAQPSGSPQRALLEWWQAFQFSDAHTVISNTSQDTVEALGEAQMEELVKTRGQGLQGIEVLSASEDGDTASVRAGLLTFQPAKEGAPPPKTPTASRPTTITMTKEDDEWKFNETALLQPMVEGLQRQKPKPKEQQQKQNTTTETTTETTPE